MKHKKVPYDQQLVLPWPVVAYIKTLPIESWWVFQIEKRDGHITVLDKAMRDQLKRKGEHVPHGWRSGLETQTSTAAGKDGMPMFMPQWVDAVLDHTPETKVKKAYRRVPAVVGGGIVLAWWCQQLGNPLG
jgi:hypothetical protein